MRDIKYKISNIGYFFLVSTLFFLVDLIIIYITSKMIPYGGFFPYQETLMDSKLPNVLTSWANFDGLHYIFIAQRGYAQYEQAFFPLYPLFLRAGSFLLGGNYIVVGIVLNLIFFALGLYFFWQLMPRLSMANRNIMTVSLLIFPASFFFHAIYTESLFFCLFLASLYFLERNHKVAVALIALFCALTRLIGVFLIIPFFLILIFKKKVTIQNVLLTISPILGLLTYCFYLWKSTGDPLYFFNSQPAFGANRSTHLIAFPQVYYRYFKIFMTSTFNFQYVIAMVEVTLFTFVLILLSWDLYMLIRAKKLGKNLWRTGLLLFSFINIVLPTTTGTFSSITRYGLLSLSIYVIIAELRPKILSGLIMTVMLMLHIILLGFFSQGYFVG